jgi:hypothetical protein
MADQSLEAFQLGASLYDRAQTQKRMMEQLQVQTAESLIQRQGMELQNKIRDNALSETIDEQAKLKNDYPNMQKNLQMRDTFFRNPNADFPTFLPVESKANQNSMFQISQQLDDFAPRARLQKAMKQIDNNALDEAAKIASTFNVKPIKPDGSIDQSVIDQYRPKLVEKEEFGKLTPEVRSIYLTQPKEMPHVEKITKANEIIANKPTAQQRIILDRQSSAIKDAENLYGPLSPGEKVQIESTATTGWKPLSGIPLTNFEGTRKIAEDADRLLERIKALEKQKPGAISKHVGLFNNTVDEIGTKIAETKDPIELESLSIIQDFQKNFNLNALLGSGKTITPNEAPRLEKELGSLKNKNFVHNFENYAKGKMRDLHSVASEYKYTARLPEQSIRQVDFYNSKYNLGYNPISKLAADKIGRGIEQTSVPSGQQKTQYQVGDRANQNGVWYQYDGVKWNPASQ